MTIALGTQLLGTHVGDGYVIRELVAEGGMGALYVAVNQFDRKKAIKIIRPEIAASYPDLIARFHDEARALSILHGNPNVVQIDGLWQFADGTHYIKMEYVEGGKSAAAWARDKHDGKAPADHVLQVVAQVVNVLDVAHGVGIVHRDLKPDNLLILRTSQSDVFVKVLDFGIAKLHTRTRLAAPLTQPKQPMGTPGYWAPEQQLGADQVDVRADIYSLAVIVFELLTGGLPPVMMSADAPAPTFVPPGWWPTLRAALSVDPVNRPENVRAFLNGLTTNLEHGAQLAATVAPRLYSEATETDSTLKYAGPIPSRPGVRSQPPPPVTTLGAAAISPATAPPANSRHGAALIAAAIVFAAAAIVITILASRRNDGPSNSATRASEPTAAAAAIDATLVLPDATPALPTATSPPDAAAPPDANTTDARPPDASMRPSPAPRAPKRRSLDDLGDL